MSKKPRKPSKPWLTRKFFISSTLVILVIASAVIGSILLWRGRDPTHVRVDAEWLNENIWRVESYKQLKSGKYDVYLLRIEQAPYMDFDTLRDVFEGTKYTSFNSYNLRDGVNCQGMVCYLASWCDITGYEYSVAWDQVHTLIYIQYEGTWYEFNFDINGSSITEVLPKYVKKGMTIA